MIGLCPVLFLKFQNLTFMVSYLYILPRKKDNAYNGFFFVGLFIMFASNAVLLVTPLVGFWFGSILAKVLGVNLVIGANFKCEVIYQKKISSVKLLFICNCLLCVSMELPLVSDLMHPLVCKIWSFYDRYKAIICRFLHLPRLIFPFNWNEFACFCRSCWNLLSLS